jgi:hypothetical protein
MEANVTMNNRLLIRQFQVQYLISREHPAPERIQSRMDETVTHGLAQNLTMALAPLFSNIDSSLWLIRSLDVEFDINIAWEQEQLVRTFASKIAHSLAVNVQGESDEENVLRFPNRAAYLARFLLDVAEGRAWSKWYYEFFSGLKLLPLSATLRTAICERAVLGKAALYQLTNDELSKILNSLTIQDARRILDSFTEGTTVGEEFGCFQAAWDAMQNEQPDTADDWRNTLRLYLAASRDREDVGGSHLKAAVLALLRLARCLVGGSLSDGEKLLAALISSNRVALYKIAGTANAEMLLSLSRCPPAWLQEVGQTLLGRNAGQIADESVTEGPRYTPFGGMFLLLPLLDEFPLEEATSGWPDADDIAAFVLVRFLLLSKCCGQSRVTRAFYDPLMRDLMGIDPSISPAVLADWQTRISPENLEMFLKTLTLWHRERGVVQGQTWVLARIPAPGSPVAVLIDGSRGVWLFVTSYHPCRPEQILESLRGCFAQYKQEDAVLLSDPVFMDTLHSAFPERKIVSFVDDTANMIADEDQQLAEILARLDKLPDDLSHLSMPKSLGLTRSFDQVLSIAAQNLMRAFAWRLPGFAGSNMPYLYSNFLDFASSIEEEPARRVVRLGRPPLHLILNMTGMERKMYTLSWLDERPFALFPEG